MKRDKNHRSLLWIWRAGMCLLMAAFCSEKAQAQSSVELITGISTKDFICGISYRQYESFYNKKIFFLYEERSHIDNYNPSYFGFRGGYALLPRLFLSLGAAYSLKSMDDFSRNVIIPTGAIDYYLMPYVYLEAGIIQYPQLCIKYSIGLSKENNRKEESYQFSRRMTR